ncbi:ROK family transcriptional regulator [Pseudarthrobacter enclensis]|uniref:NBD/HSP70 family sugar kinase n=1 Tax=Pseudarthrobacter enclensis TaxID=993070 RepID=A0ABT9RR42_9MICC|nr:ROK family transcriptional regulator [Pseudarthrobacter enclensis]MDP9887532.1 putative NBD/HSP70 family sugar kinase [Pseudarthrobacter enclensis]
MTVERVPAGLVGATSHGHLLELIRAADGLSRQQLLSTTGMSRATLYERLDTLTRRGYIYEAEPLDSTGGRPSRKIRFEDRGRVVLAITLGQTHGTVSIADTAGRQLRSFTKTLDVSDPAESVLGPLIREGQALLAQGKNETLLGIGVSLPAPVEAGTGHVRHPTTLPGWAADSVVAAVNASWDLPLVVENDARAAGLGERRSDAETVVYVKVGTGIGCGIVVEGSILRGAHGAAGDIGHIRMTPDGPLCRCGRRGCLAAYSSGRALSEKLSARGFKNMAAIRAAAGAGDPAVLGALESAAEVLGSALAATVTTLNPDRLVLGGEVGSMDFFAQQVGERVLADVVDRIGEGLVVETGHQEDVAACSGLATLVMRKIFAPGAVDQVFSEEAVRTASGNPRR